MMRRSSGRPGLLTGVYRTCYTSTFGLVVFTVLHVYCNANNETEVANTVNITDIQRERTMNITDNALRFLTRSTWLRGFKLCRDVYNMTMASDVDINDIKDISAGREDRSNDTNNGTTYWNLLEQKLPVWTYAFEVTNQAEGKTVLIKRNDVELHKNMYECLAENGTKETKCCASLKDAHNSCGRKDAFQLHLPEMQPTTFYYFAQDIWIKTPRWVTLKDEFGFLSKNDNLTVRCLMLDENGELRTDDCNAQHRTLCLGGTTQEVAQYVGKEKIPPYTPSTTKRDPSGRSSPFTKSPSTSSKQDTNSTNFSTVNISTSPVQDQSDIWMDPQIRYSIIAVGSFIVLAVLVAVCCCCCRKRRKSAKDRRKSARLADMYSDTADSIAMKETSVYETADTSEYAIPEDSLKKARHRQSIGENEYDVISKSNKTQNKFSGNAYNHVTLVSSKDRRGSSNQDENTYDVTNYGKQNAVVISPNDLKGNVYGEIEIKTER